MIAAREIRRLRAWSARWGSDPDLVQGAGGNTSLKADGRLLVKASGTRLADAEQADIFVEVDLAAAAGVLDGLPLQATEGLRPSIETSLHAVMPHRFVAHLHAVDVMAWAVRRDAEAALARPLDGLPWGFVPYRRPGTALGTAVRDLVRARPVDIVILGNHGVIIGGDSCEAVAAALGGLRERLQTPRRTCPANNGKLRVLADKYGLEPARFAEAHLAATDPVNLAFAVQGSLWPDHVVFLGRGASRLDPVRTDGQSASLLTLVPGVGALLPRGAPLDAQELAACLGAVVSRIPAGARLDILAAEEETELLQWDAETYRQELARVQAAGRTAG